MTTSSVPTWIAGELSQLFCTYLGNDWIEHHDDAAMWDAVLAIPDEELWTVRQSLRRYLFTFVRDRARLKPAHRRPLPGARAAKEGDGAKPA